jgi:hypothetical protein
MGVYVSLAVTSTVFPSLKPTYFTYLWYHMTGQYRFTINMDHTYEYHMTSFGYHMTSYGDHMTSYGDHMTWRYMTSNGDPSTWDHKEITRHHVSIGMTKRRYHTDISRSQDIAQHHYITIRLYNIFISLINGS